MDSLPPRGDSDFSALVLRSARDGLAAIRTRRPRVHCITNTVAQAFTANALLALGAVPSMTTATDEIAAFAGSADALLVNLGTLEPERRAVIRTAIEAASEAGRPWLLDPVFIDRSAGRAAFARDLAALAPAAIRGNGAEIAVLGPDEDLAMLARRLATVVAATGETDVVTDGQRLAAIANGHPLMARVTAMGCAGAAITAAFLAVGEDACAASGAAMLVLGIAGESAAETSRGPGSFAAAYLDALYGMDPADIAPRARIAPPPAGEAP
ncbi:MAG: hydroxyethylthiazole kinase [Phreatobacter sp.]|uniref:hydroxyethylthiazole kinase n=1 Tax=Phreatobacter sp. TaxID=1966341 RepID=UPI0027375BC2|nr:hydroxyethylthiazole kinase [Phreatobacter sp.]MDP2804034.1 hydroxyethylthiazole kinase [Phreatobacter sp.]